MKFLRYSVMLSACLFLTACDEDYSGVLSLQQQVVLKLKKSDLVLPAGNYNTEISASSSKVKLKVQVNGAEQKVEFKLAKGVKIKTFNDVDLAPDVSGQPYRIKGDENTEYEDSSSVRTTESCTYSTIERQCGYERGPQQCTTQTTCANQADPNTCQSVRTCVDGPTQYICRDVSVSHSGTHDVEYYMTYWTTTRHLQVIDSATNAALGVFSNQTTDSNKHYTYQGACY